MVFNQLLSPDPNEAVVDDGEMEQLGIMEQLGKMMPSNEVGGGGRGEHTNGYYL